jgi:hypothetical protein
MIFPSTSLPWRCGNGQIGLKPFIKIGWWLFLFTYISRSLTENISWSLSQDLTN